MRSTLAGLRTHALDAALALALTLWIEFEILVRETVAGPKIAVAPLFLLQTVPLAWRRRAPLLVACLLMASAVPHAVATGNAPEGGPGFFAVLIVLYSLGAYADTRRALAGVVVVAAGYVVHELNNPNIETEAQLWSALFAAAIAAIVLVAGIYVRRHREAKALERRAAALERGREEEARAAVAEERSRIARELHDIVSHSVSVMVVQAEAAEEVLAREPDRAGEPLRKIQRVGREALGDMRRMLGVLRDDHADAALDPQPGLSRLGELVEQVTSSGLPVEVTIEGEPRALPPGIDLAVYRVIQEALTNALKHAGRARAEVVLRYADTHVDVEILDDGEGARSPGRGHGLAGMRERISLYGGTLSLGARSDRGFAVRAHLPLP